MFIGIVQYPRLGKIRLQHRIRYVSEITSVFSLRRLIRLIFGYVSFYVIFLVSYIIPT